MKKSRSIFLLLMAFVPSLAQSQNLISVKHSLEELKRVLIAQPDWKPFPALDDRQGWAKADKNLLSGFASKAETFLDYDWQLLFPKIDSFSKDR